MEETETPVSRRFAYVSRVNYSTEGARRPVTRRQTVAINECRIYEK